MHDDDERLSQPRQPKGGRRAGTAGGILVTLGALALKFKAALLALSSLKWLVFAPKLALSFGTMFISIFFYALFFGWKFGIVLVALLAVHELGHYLTFRNLGIPASLPTFVPGLGAFVSSPMSADPANNAFAAIMGPVFGIAASAICWGFGLSSGDNFWIAAAYFGFFINLFNLLPVVPLDGGRAAAAMTPWMWFLGFGVLVSLVFLDPGNPILLIIVLFSGFQTYHRWQQRKTHSLQQAAYYRVAPRHRLLVGAVYVGLIVALVFGMNATHILSSGGHSFGSI
jgi:Zn-dependent protease